MSCERRIYPYWLNRATHITSLVNLLRTTEGLSADVPTVVSDNIWTAIYVSAFRNRIVSTSDGTISSDATYTKHYVIPVPLSTQQYT